MVTGFSELLTGAVGCPGGGGVGEGEVEGLVALTTNLTTPHISSTSNILVIKNAKSFSLNDGQIGINNDQSFLTNSDGRNW